MDRLQSFLSKGVMVISALWDNKDNAKKALDAVKNVAQEYTTEGQVSDEKLDKAEIILDTLIDEFNLDMPE